MCGPLRRHPVLSMYPSLIGCILFAVIGQFICVYAAFDPQALASNCKALHAYTVILT